MMKKLLRFAGMGIAWLAVAMSAAWAFGALHFDFPVWNGLVSWSFVAAVLAVLILVRPLPKKFAA